MPGLARRHVGRALLGAASLFNSATLFAQPSVAAEATLASAYQWRGLTVVNRPVVQPAVSLAAPLGGTTFTVGIDGSIEPMRYDGLRDISESGGRGPDLAEVSAEATVARVFGRATLTGGVARYFYPNALGTTSSENTTELVALLELDVPLAPSLEWHHDVGLVRGAYVEGALHWDARLPRERVVSFAAAAGLNHGQGPSDRDAVYFAARGLTHADLSASTSLTAGALTVEPTVHLVLARDAMARIAAPDASRTAKIWAGATLSWERAFARPRRVASTASAP